MTIEISKFCVYTLREKTVLDAVGEGGSAEFTENRKWVDGARQFRQAQAEGQRMAIVFSDAAYGGGLNYYAFLTNVEVLAETPAGPTRYAFHDLRHIRGNYPLSYLIKKNGDAPLSDNYIRPYVVCYTPKFIYEEAAAEADKQPDESGAAHEPRRSPSLIQRALESIRLSRTGNSVARIFLIGYAGRTPEDILSALGDRGVLVDIRIRAGSRNPAYNKSALARVFGERYYHVPQLGNRDYRTGGIRISDPDAGLAIVEEVAAVHDRVFLMCACADGASCHRTTVGAMLSSRGYRVQEYRG